MQMTLYTTHCPKCTVLEKKLKAKGVEYTEVTDTAKMTEMGFKSAPMLDVDGRILSFVEANKYINSL